MRRNFNSADHHTLSARVIARLSTFAGRACLAAAVAVAALTLPLAPANAALGKEQGAANASLDFNKKDGAPSLYIEALARASGADVTVNAKSPDASLNRRRPSDSDAIPPAPFRGWWVAP